jgi:acetamidase/formamidase
MNRRTAYTIHTKHHHLGWSRDQPPVRRVTPGDVVTFETIDASGGQIRADATAEVIGRMDSSRVNPVTGPVFVEGARPGDALVIETLDFTPAGWGWTAIIPGFGLLAEEFPSPKLHLWHYDAQRPESAAFGPHARVPLKSMIGTIGVAPAEPGRHDVIPPRRVGGNMDLRDIQEGSVLTLPVEVPGALLSVGDTHAAQGDGEVCGTAIESAMTVRLKLTLEKDAAPPFPRLLTNGPVTQHLDQKGYQVATGIGPDLMEAARDAVRNMIDLLTSGSNLGAEDAYMLCSVCGDLRISEIVDAPNWMVALYFPRCVLE